MHSSRHKREARPGNHTPGTPPARSADRRVLRTRRALRDALIALLEKKGWDDFGVQEICAEADIGRSTFYLHYQGKEELLAGSLGDLRSFLQEQAGTAGGPGGFAFLRGLLEHVHEQRNVFRSLIGRRSGQVVQNRFREMMLQLIQQELSGGEARRWELDAAAHALTGALFGLMSWWIEAAGDLPLEAVEDYFRRVAAPVIEGLARSDR